MTTYAVNAETGASTRYLGYGFDSFCKGIDGKHYGIKSDGLYLLEGDADAEIDFGDLDFGTSGLKAIRTAYASGGISDALELVIGEGGNEWSYTSRGYDSRLSCHRFDTGMGLRSNYFSVKLKNIGGSYFTLDALELAALPLARRI